MHVVLNCPALAIPINQFLNFFATHAVNIKDNFKDRMNIRDLSRSVIFMFSRVEKPQLISVNFLKLHEQVYFAVGDTSTGRLVHMLQFTLLPEALLNALSWTTHVIHCTVPTLFWIKQRMLHPFSL